jgi:hypothetical protein
MPETTNDGPKPYIEDQWNGWSLKIYDDLDDKTRMRVRIFEGDRLHYAGTYPSYRIYTFVAHWTDTLSAATEGGA